MSTPTRNPLVLWSQRTKTVAIKLEVSDCKDEELKIEGNHLVFKGKNKEAHYALDVELYGGLNRANTARHIELVVPKATVEWWPCLLKANIQADSDQWLEEEDAVLEENQKAHDASAIHCRECGVPLDLAKIATHYNEKHDCDLVKAKELQKAFEVAVYKVLSTPSGKRTHPHADPSLPGPSGEQQPKEAEKKEGEPDEKKAKTEKSDSEA
ncbi:Co-chaperone protein daf-41 [Aphelenchoides fujianensis]|nr:Co-chaperone protein daf-41 [Aphelenchoides fujianensis]